MKIIEIISAGFVAWLGLLFTGIVIYSVFYGWEITLAFNDYNEGIIEVVIFSTFTILNIYFLIKRIGKYKLSVKPGAKGIVKGVMGENR